MSDFATSSILIIDPNAHMRRLIANLLSCLSIDTLAEARSISAISTLKIDPQLIILDWPADPTETILMIHRIRRGDLFDSRVPILALTPHIHHSVLELAWQNKVDEVIAKPISAIELIKRAAALLDERWTWQPSEDSMAAQRG